MTEKRRIYLNSPVLAFDYPNDGDPIWPCQECLPWHVEVVESEEGSAVMVREWHGVDCPVLIEWYADAPKEDKGPGF